MDLLPEGSQALEKLHSDPPSLLVQALRQEHRAKDQQMVVDLLERTL
jgi:hypothetical protein